VSSVLLMPDAQDLIGVQEIAALAGVSRAAVANWRSRFRDFPQPIAQIAAGPVFHAGQVRAWLRKRKVPMATAISTINLKGGVGKTTLTVAVAQMLAGEFGKRILVVDLDPQTNATVMLIDEDRWRELDDQRLTVADLFEAALRADDVAPFDLTRCILTNVGGVRDVRGVSLLPSSLRLIDLQEKLVTINPGQFYAATPIDILRRAIRPVLDDYDFVLIDCPPSLGLITLNGLRISNYYIIPTIADILSTYGIPQIVRRVRMFSHSVGEPIEPLGIVATKYQEQMTTHRTQLQRLREERDAPVFETKIPQNDKIAGAAEYREVGTYRQKWGYGERHYEAFRALTQEILDKVQVPA
jgi:chromosome partitioning protein